MRDAQFDQFQFARQVAVNLVEPRHAVELFQQVLPLGVAERGQVAGHEIGQPARVR